MTFMPSMYVMDRIDGVLGVYAYDNGAVDTGLWGDLDLAQLDKDEKLESDLAQRLFKVGNDHAYNVAADANKLTVTPCDYYEYKLIDNDDNGKYDYLIVYPIKDAEVIAADKDGIKVEGNTIYKYEDCTIATGLVKGDMAMIEEDTTLKTEFVISELALEKGTVDHFTSKYNVITNMTIGSTEYDICSTADHQKEVKPLLAAKKVSFNVINGYAVNVAIDDSIALSELLLVTNLEEGYDADYTYDAKAMFSDGSIKDIDISKLNGSYTNITEIAKHLEMTSQKYGYLAKYDEVSGAYELTSMDKIPGADYSALGFDSVIFDGTFGAAGLGDDDATINGIEFADDAIVYLADVSGKETVYSVVTGADVATLNGINVCYYAGVNEAANGHDYVTFAFIKTDSVSESADNYGILTSDVVWYDYNDKNVDYATFSVWNGTEEVTVTAEVGEMVENTAFETGDVIWFRTNDGKIINMELLDTTLGSVVKYDSSDYDAEVYIDTNADGDGNAYPIDADALIMGAAEGTSAAIEKAGEGLNGVIKNILFADVDNDGDLDVIIMDANGIDLK